MYHGERFNGLSHLLASLAATAGATVLVTFAVLGGDLRKVLSSVIYGAGLVLIYAASTVYHSTPPPTKAFFRKLDHMAIYVMIAGTYTPFCFVALRAEHGSWLALAEWLLAGLGILLELTYAHRSRSPSLALYFVMGLLSVAALKPLLAALAWSGLLWLLGGGALYVMGFGFYLLDEKFRHFHGIWHLFVVGASACQYVSIFSVIVSNNT